MRVEFEFSTYLKTTVLFSYALSIFKYFSDALEIIWGMIFVFVIALQIDYNAVEIELFIRDFSRIYGKALPFKSLY